MERDDVERRVREAVGRRAPVRYQLIAVTIEQGKFKAPLEPDEARV